LLLRWGVATVVMKNWQPLELGPLFYKRISCVRVCIAPKSSTWENLDGCSEVVHLLPWIAGLVGHALG
jgi:hypothetical protein